MCNDRRHVLADVTALTLHRVLGGGMDDASGIYHLVVQGETPGAAKRPRNSRLAAGKLQQRFGLQLPHWQAGVKRMLQETL